ncbi:MAG: hypothetical protein GY909_11470 [Oligoflexia bacterium]|nr:hypothetical protein [Oligoflexia bacterium]
MKLLISLLVISYTTLASVPTPEGLLRNPNNKEITDNYVVVKFSVEKKKDDVLSVQQIAEPIETAGRELQEDLANGELKELDKTVYIKAIFEITENKKVNLLQAIYDNGKMNRTDMINYIVKKDYTNVISQEPNAEIGLFYSVLSMLALNSSKVFMDYLKTNNVLLPSNKELLHKEKIALYDKYKTYLRLKKEDEESEIENPLDPQEEEQQTIVKETLNKPFFDQSNIVRLVKDVSGYFWEVEKDGFWAKFENGTKRLNRLKLNKASSVLDVSLDEFIVYDGKHEFPRFVNFKSFNNEQYIVRTLDVSYFTNTNVGFDKRVKAYKEAFEKNSENLAKKTEVVAIPPFILRE